MENLEIEPFAPDTDVSINTINIDEIRYKYESHPSIIKIKENVENKFLFNDITPNDFKKEICKLDPKKASIANDISTKILIESSDIVCDPLANIYNISKNETKYPQTLKVADVM